MTPLERALALSQGRPVDRLPCIPIVGNTAARVLGVDVAKLRQDADSLARSHIASYRLFGYDNVRVFTDLFTLAEAMGAQITVPQNETAYQTASAFTAGETLSSLEQKAPLAHPLLLAQLTATRQTVDALASEVPVTAALIGPFTLAAFLAGTEHITRLIRRDPEQVHALCRLSLRVCKDHADAILATGASPSLTDAMSSTSVIGPANFRTFSKPYLQELTTHILKKRPSVTLHICGKTESIWQDMADTGATTLSLDNDVQLTAAVATVGSRVRLMGNVPPSQELLQGNPASIRQAVFRCLLDAGDSPKGFIVASGCSLPTETPFSNIHAMLQAVSEAAYPLNPEKLAQETCQ